MKVDLRYGEGHVICPTSYTRTILIVPINGYRKEDLDVFVDVLDDGRQTLFVATKPSVDSNVNQILRASKFADCDVMDYIRRESAFTNKTYIHQIASFSIDPKGNIRIDTEIMGETLIIELTEDAPKSNHIEIDLLSDD